MQKNKSIKPENKTVVFYSGHEEATCPCSVRMEISSFYFEKKMATKKSLGKFPVFHFGAAFRIGFSPEKRIGERKNVLHFFFGK